MRRSRSRRRTHNRRRRRRNSWFGAHRRHRRAALKGWRGRRKGRRGRRRARRRNPMFGFNPRRHRRGRRSRRYNRRRGRRGRRRNPTALGRPLAMLRQTVTVPSLTRYALVAGGMMGNAILTNIAAGYVPIDALKTRPGNYVTGLGVGALTAFGGSMFLPSSIVGPYYFGSVLEVVSRVLKDYVLPMLPIKGLLGLGDYLTRGDAMTARPLGDYLTRGDAMTARPLGDYLTRGDASMARPLGAYYDYYGEDTIADELAGL